MGWVCWTQCQYRYTLTLIRMTWRKMRSDMAAAWRNSSVTAAFSDCPFSNIIISHKYQMWLLLIQNIEVNYCNQHYNLIPSCRGVNILWQSEWVQSVISCLLLVLYPVFAPQWLWWWVNAISFWYKHRFKKVGS